MSAPVRILTVLAAALLGFSAARAQSEHIPVVSAARPVVLPASGDGEHGWFALPGDAGFGFPTLYHLPPGSEPGTVRGGPRLRSFPEAIASADDRVVLVMPPERLDGATEAKERNGAGGARNDPPARLIRRVQWVRVMRASAGGLWEYHPRGREPIAMPSLPGRGELRGVAMHEGVVLALLHGAPAHGTETGFDGPREDALYALSDGATVWTRVRLPEGWAADIPGFVVAFGGRVALLQGGNSWETHALTGQNGAIDEAPIWTPADLRADPQGGRVVTAGSSVVVVRVEPDGLALDLVREDSRVPLASIEHEVSEFAVVGGGDLLTVIWRGEGDPARLHATVVSAISGALLYDDFARTNAVVSGREIQSLALLVGALMLTILVFVLRPEEALGGAVAMPEGYAMASPLRRVGAVLIDLAPMLVLCSFVFGVSGRELLDAAVLSDESTTLGAGALGAAFVLTAIHSALCEWLFGRTLGKAALRCRTISVRGERPRLWQTTIRTVVKLLFPPFALFLFLDIRRRHPGDLVAGTAVVQRHRPPGEGPAPDEGAPPS